MITNWIQLDRIVEPRAVRDRRVIEGGYDQGDDDLVVDQARSLIVDTAAELIFVYLCGPDLAGHEHGWASAAYDEALSRADERLGRLLAVGGDVAFVVSTDHGGNETRHTDLDEETLTTFVAARSPRIPAGSCWPEASILDIAPTVADLLGLPPDPQWEGASLLGRELPLVDWMMTALASMAEHRYGEDLDMLSHSLQTAARAEAEGASPALTLAALLHDVGHTLGPATEWGYPEHDRAGARALQPWLSPSVVEPVRLHVDAKRYLVATDPTYVDQLSRASVESLRQQGGSFTEAEATAFIQQPGASAAVALRRYDDGGKVLGREVPELVSYRPLLEAALHDSQPVDARWARDSCRCESCRDAGNGQRLFDTDELDGWTVVDSASGPDGLEIELARGPSERHRCLVHHPVGIEQTTSRWRVAHGEELRRRAVDGSASLDPFLADLSRHGIALVTGAGSTPGTVLDIAERVGFVRRTNYGDLFDVVSETDPINLAYTPKGLPLHTDNPYRDPVPTVQLLHCLHAASEGGASLFCDGMAAAEDFRLAAPADFEVLVETPVVFRFSSDDTDLRAEVPVISVDQNGRITRVTINNRSMESLSPGPSADRFYEAYSRFASSLAASSHTIEFTLADGDLIAFDNRRVLHGRRGFAADPNRHLQGCYVDIDAVHSQVRVARR